MKSFCIPLRKHAAVVINFEKKTRIAINRK